MIKLSTEVDERPKVCLFFDDGELTMDSLGEATAEDIFGESAPEETDKNDEITDADDEVNPDEIFKEEDNQEIVGGEDNNKETAEQPESKSKGSSPKTTFYSSALKALKDDGILPDLEEEFITNVKSPEDFAEAIEKQVAARMSESERRIKEALDNNVQIDDVKRFENAINYLDSIEDDALEADDEAGESLRKQIIYQDYINKGFKPERAEKEVAKAFNAGTDIEDAKAALESNKEHFKDEYDNLIEDKKKETLKLKKEREAQAKEFQKKVLETESPFDIKIDKLTRQKIYENAVKPIHKDKDGQVLTTIQKYSKDNPIDAEYYLSLFYTMTDGFKNIDKFVGQKVNKAKKSALNELENKLKNTPLNGDGSVDFDFGKTDEQSFFKDLKINI